MPSSSERQSVDGRAKPGHDEEETAILTIEHSLAEKPGGPSL
jgi:hypothetical protein